MLDEGTLQAWEERAIQIDDWNMRQAIAEIRRLREDLMDKDAYIVTMKAITVGQDNDLAAHRAVIRGLAYELESHGYGADGDLGILAHPLVVAARKGLRS